jgi:predicted ABC-type ATPase
LLERIAELTGQRANFGFETTLSGRTYVKLFEDIRRTGYRVGLFFLWLPSVEMAIGRVESRVQAGGHHIPEDVIRRRYALGLRNFFRLYRPVLDQWWLYDASRQRPRLIAVKKLSGQIVVNDKGRFRRVKREGETER